MPQAVGIVRLRDVARVELGSQQYDQSCTLDGQPSVALSIYQLPGSNALDTADGVYAKMKELKTRFPEGWITRSSTTPRRSSASRSTRSSRRCATRSSWWRSWCWSSCRTGGRRDPADRRAGRHHRHLRRHGGAGLQPEQPVAVRPGAGDRHRGGRRHRGASRTSSGWLEHGLDAARRPRIKAMDEVTGPVLAVALVLCAVFVPCCVHRRHHRPVLPPVRGDHRRLDGHLGLQRADAEPRAGGHPAQAARRPPRPADPAARPAAGLVLPAVQRGLRRRARTLYTRAGRRAAAGQRARRCWSTAACWSDLLGVRPGARPASSRSRTRAICSSTCSCRTPPRWSGRSRSWPASRRSPARRRASSTPSASPASR